MKTFRFQALGTIWYLKFNSDFDKDNYNELKALVKTFEKTYSRFDSDSDLSKFNNSKTWPNPPLELLEMLDLGDQIYTLTNGEYSLLLGAEMESMGYGKDFLDMSLSDTKALSKTWTTTSVGSDYPDKDYFNGLLRLKNHTLQIVQDLKLDLNSLAKGCLVDILTNWLKNKGYKNFMVNGGGDIYISGRETVILENPFNNKQKIGEVSLADQSIAASSNNKRVINQKGHILNAKDHIAAAHVIAPKTVLADALSTAACIASKNSLEKIVDSFDAEFLIIYKTKITVQTEYFGAKLYTHA